MKLKKIMKEVVFVLIIKGIEHYIISLNISCLITVLPVFMTIHHIWFVYDILRLLFKN